MNFKFIGQGLYMNFVDFALVHFKSNYTKSEIQLNFANLQHILQL